MEMLGISLETQGIKDCGAPLDAWHSSDFETIWPCVETGMEVDPKTAGREEMRLARSRSSSLRRPLCPLLCNWGFDLHDLSRS
ncbi:hypothetical protein AAC387_Pa01g3123 [Persea americana]